MSFMEIFQPGLKHLREERQRQQHDIAYPTDGADPLVDINLDAGTATILIPTRAGQASPEPGATPAPTSSPNPSHRTSTRPPADLTVTAPPPSLRTPPRTPCSATLGR